MILITDVAHGFLVGVRLGLAEGFALGLLDGLRDGLRDGLLEVRWAAGFALGRLDGFFDGDVGFIVGDIGLVDGDTLGVPALLFNKLAGVFPEILVRNETLVTSDESWRVSEALSIAVMRGGCTTVVDVLV